MGLAAEDAAGDVVAPCDVASGGRASDAAVVSWMNDVEFVAVVGGADAAADVDDEADGLDLGVADGVVVVDLSVALKLLAPSSLARR